MDQPIQERIDRLSALLLDLQPAQIDNIVQEAQQEALNEAKQIIKAALVQAILQRAVNHLAMSAADCAEQPAVAETLLPEPRSRSAANAGHDVQSGGLDDRAPLESTPVSEPRSRSEASAGHDVESGGPDDRAAIKREIEAIRRQLRANEERLAQPAAGNNGSAAAVDASGLDEGSVKDRSVPSAEETVAVQAGTSGTGYYVYCIVTGDPAQPLHDLPTAGIDTAYPVYVLSCYDLQAVVSRVSLDVFDQEQLESRLQDMDWVQEKAYIHQNVLDIVMTQRPLVPMRFCSIYRSEEGLREMLQAHRTDFVAALAKLVGCQEWAVKVFFEPKQLRTFTAQLSEPVQAFKAKMDAKSDGAAYFMEKQLENLIKEEAESVGDRATQTIHERLGTYARECHAGALQDKRITGRKETMTLNGAYLVDVSRLDVFKEELDMLRSEFGEAGVILDLSGPWPPYNFVMIGKLEEQSDAPIAG